MTIANTLAEIASEIEKLSADLKKVRAATDLLGKTAISKARDIERALDDAKERFSAALARQADDARERRLAAFSDISVEARPGETLLSTGFIIRYTKRTWDVDLGKTVPKPHVCNGFLALANDAFEYLVSVRPEAIPPQIMALAPGDPREAFNIYLAAKSRGYLQR